MEPSSIPILFSEDEIAERIEALAAEIAAELHDELMIVSLLKGSFVFTSDLIRALYRIGVQPQIDFMTVSSYGAGTESGELMIHRDISEDVKGRTVLLVDDILETGRTLDAAHTLLTERGAGNIRIAVLLEKPGKLDRLVKADFVGFTVPDRFVVGYGLDYGNHYRELPFIGYLEIH